MDLEEIWRIREEEIYPLLFGACTRGIFPLTPDVFKRFGDQSIDPRWLFEGVFEFAPTSERSTWLYVTSGLSNPWEIDPPAYTSAGQSGGGIEFVFVSTEQGDWAIQVLQNMLAFDLLLSANRFPNRGPLMLGDRIPLRSPINGVDSCVLRNVVVANPDLLPDGFSLPSGEVKFLVFVGVSDREIEFAKLHGSNELIGRLSVAGQCPTTDPRRKSLF